MPRPSPNPNLSSMLFSTGSHSGSPMSLSRSGLSSSFSKPSLSDPSIPTPAKKKKKHCKWTQVDISYIYRIYKEKQVSNQTTSFYLCQNQGSMGNWALVWCFAFAWLVEAWGLSGKDGQASRPLCWMAGSRCGGEHPLACLRCVSSSRPSASSPLEGYAVLWTRR